MENQLNIFNSIIENVIHVPEVKGKKWTAALSSYVFGADSNNNIIII